MQLKQLLIFIVILIPVYTMAQADSIENSLQKERKYISLQSEYQRGHVFATNDFLRGLNTEYDRIDDFQTFSIKFSTQTTGKKLWEQLYNYPAWGLAIYTADFQAPEEIGYPIAIYGFFNGPFRRWEKVSFNYELGFGATFNWRSFNPITNQYNIAIGAGQSFIIDAGMNLQYNITKRIDLITGFSLTHFSNGALKKPNFGINTIAPKIGIKYNFYDQPSFKEQEVPDFRRKNEWLLSGFGGTKNVIFDTVNIDILEKYEGVFFPVFGLSAGYNRQISYKSKIGFGMTISYDGSVNAQVAIEENELDPVDSQFIDKVQLSIYPSYELVINSLSLVLQPAFYIYRKEFADQSPAFFQRIGLKYYLSDNLYMGVILRDYAFHVSDYIEWTIGYRFRRK